MCIGSSAQQNGSFARLQFVVAVVVVVLVAGPSMAVCNARFNDCVN